MKIVVYGMGINGRELFRALQNIDKITIVATMDANTLVKNSLDGA
jgi:glyceraldehyde-3-phosphate dehydrogenase/erythrose-4-phosphate dehydrogenase